MIKRYYATKDNTITNAYAENLTTRGSDANMGASDILEVFSIYGQTQDMLGAFSTEEAHWKKLGKKEPVWTWKAILI